MKKKDLKKELAKMYSNLNCRIGRYFTIADYHKYGKNASAIARKILAGKEKETIDAPPPAG